MEEILKSLQGKSITKKNLFDFLSEINLEKLSTDKEKNTNIYEDVVIHPIKEELIQEKKRRGRKPKEKPIVEQPIQEKKRRGRKPKEKPIIEQPPEEKPFIEDPPKEKKRRGRKPKDKPKDKPIVEIQIEEKKPIKGIHLIVNELLEKATTNSNNLECKFCKYTFSTKRNLHTHFNIYTLCNSMAYDEFKKVISNFNT